MNTPWQDLAEDVIAADPRGDKDSWGRAFLAAAGDDHQVSEWLRQREISHTGDYVAGVRAREQAARSAERRQRTGVAIATGRPISPTLSVRDETGKRRLMLWVDATPAQFVDAVVIEQRVAEGRISANAVRMTLAEAIKDDDELMELPTLAAVCERLGIDPDSLGLDELDEVAS